MKYKQIYEKFRIEGGIQKFTTLISQSIKMVLEYQNHRSEFLIFFETLSSRVCWLAPCGKETQNIETVLETDKANNYVLFLVFL